MASLQILKGADNQAEFFSIDAEKVVLGRNPDCHVVISGTSVSRAHAHIVRLQGKYFIEDMKSRNGTFVNNEAIIGRTQLKNEDKIKICDFMCIFHESQQKPLPVDLRRGAADPDAEDEEEGSSAPIEATLSHVRSTALLETQPKEKLKALLDISTSLSRTFDLNTLLPKIVDSLFQLFRQADRAFVIMLDESTKKLLPKVIKTRRPQDETNARFSRRIVNKSIEEVAGLLSDDAATDSRFSMSQSIADFRIRSVMCAPLWSQDSKGIGVIQLDTQDRSKKFTQDDLDLLMGVASQASMALENAKMHADLLARERLKRDLELAREVQRGFLPSKSPEIPGYEFYAYYESAYEIGGDYYDFIPLPENRLAIMLGDVAGKGVPAALLMAKISSDSRFCMLTDMNPAAAITKLNELLSQSSLMDRFVTLAAAVIDLKTNIVTLVNAGHPSPIVYRRSSDKLEDATPKDISGLPIGVLEGFVYESCQVQLQPGDSIVIYSDGVTDAMDINNVALQTKGLLAAVQGTKLTAHPLGERLVKVVKEHAAGRSQHDDITLVTFGRKGG